MEAVLLVELLVATAVITSSFATVRNMESSIHTDKDVKVDDNRLNSKIEEIVTPLGIVPSRIVTRSGRHGSCSAPESRAQSEQSGASK